MKKLLSLVLVLCLAVSSTFATQASFVADFEDLSFASEQEYWNGSDLSGGFDQNGGLVSFANQHYSWGGNDTFSYSKVSDTTTAGFGNQYAAYPGSGAGSSANYAVFNEPYSVSNQISFAVDSEVAGFNVANTTYAAISMLKGDDFAKQFTQDDWFKLTVIGFDASGESVGIVEFLLADGTDILAGWDWVDLSSLGSNVRGLSFDLSSTDNGSWGMNTPAYFAMDNLTFVPEPATLAILGFGGILLRRKKA